MEEKRKEKQDSYEKRGYLLTDFKLFHLKDAAGTEVPYHYHEFHKLLFLCSGEGNYYIEGEEYGLQEGDIVLVGSRQVHRPEFLKGMSYERIILYISPEFLKKNSTEDCDLEAIFAEDQPALLHGSRENTYLSAFLEKLEAEMAEKTFGGEVVCTGLLLQLLVGIARIARREKGKKAEGAETGEKPEAQSISGADITHSDKKSRVWEILRYLELHFSEEITMDLLSEKFFVSRYHMMRQFKEETGQSIYDCLTERRLLHARNLIKQGISSTESCYSSGFRSYSSFTRAYAKRFATTPTGRIGHTMKREETYE